jgi:hypothetical protein
VASWSGSSFVHACDQAGGQHDHGACGAAGTHGQQLDTVQAAGSSGCGAAADAAGSGGEAAAAGQAPTVVPAASGMRASVDPNTGKLADVPAPPVPPNAHLRAVDAQAASPELPVERPLPGGGAILDTTSLRHQMSATVAKDGSLTTHCKEPASTPEQAK